MSRVVILCVLCLILSPTSSSAQVIPFPESLEMVREHIINQPEDFSVACMPLNDPSRMVLYNNQPFPLASVSKLMILIEYAQRIDAGLLSMDDEVSIEELERYNLPRTDRGAHERFLERYPASTTSVNVWDVAIHGMMQYSSNAASDYMLDYLSPVDWAGLYADMQMLNTDYPHPLTMIALLMNNHETGMRGFDDIPNLSMLQGMEYYIRYTQDSDWHDQELTYRSPRSRRNFPSWEVQASILQEHTATGIVYDFLTVMQSIYGDNSPFSLGTQTMLQAALRWQGNNYLSENYIEYGSKLGFYSGGVQTLVAFGYPRAGERVVTATFFRNLPRDTYEIMTDRDSIGVFTHWMNFNACAGLGDFIETTINEGESSITLPAG